KAVAKKHQKVRRQRQDFHHKVALYLVRHSDTISLEDLQVATRVQQRPLAKSSSDAGWGQVRTTLEYKAACAGKQVRVVAPHYTSQNCWACGERVKKSHAVRTPV